VAPVPTVTGYGPDRPRLDGLSELRKGFTTKLVTRDRDGTPPEVPPRTLFNLVRYPSPAGRLAAYVTPPPKAPGRHPAVLWIAGGFSNGVGNDAWAPADPANDQSAAAFREAGLVLMLPSFRGGNDNPGFRENLYGEVDDALAAADFLAKLEYVDAKRIYLGGHSTGGTMVLLVAAASDRFRAVFSFGPVAWIDSYGQDNLVFDVNDQKEVRLRSPAAVVRAIVTRTFVIEGTTMPSNTVVFPELERWRGSAPVRLFRVDGASHFSILLPVTRLLAQKIRDDRGAGIELTAAELAAAISAQRRAAN